MNKASLFLSLTATGLTLVASLPALAQSAPTSQIFINEALLESLEQNQGLPPAHPYTHGAGVAAFPPYGFGYNPVLADPAALAKAQPLPPAPLPAYGYGYGAYGHPLAGATGTAFLGHQGYSYGAGVLPPPQRVPQSTLVTDGLYYGAGQSFYGLVPSRHEENFINGRERRVTRTPEIVESRAASAAPSGVFTLGSDSFQSPGTTSTSAASPSVATVADRQPIQAESTQTTAAPEQQSHAVAAGQDADIVLTLHFARDDSALAGENETQLIPVIRHLSGSTTRVMLVAYAKGEEESAARSLALRRALAVRDYLIERGIESARIEVRANQSAEEDSQGDRVEIQAL